MSSELKLEISANDVHGFLQEALCKALGPDVRDKLVTEAVAKLLRGTWQSDSDLQRVFQSAVRDVAEGIAKEELTKPENQEKLRQIVVDSWNKLMSGERREKLAENIASVIANGLFGRNY